MVFTVHPAKDRPRAAAAVAFGLGLLLQALWQWLEPATALCLWAALLFSLRDFFAPSRYLLTSEGVRVEGPLRAGGFYPWRRFRAYVRDRNGIFLTPYRKRRASEGKRGLFLPLGREQRDRFERYCRQQGLERRAR